MVDLLAEKRGDYFRYTLIAAITGLLDFAIALAMLRLRFSPQVSLGVSIAIAGVINYLALEWWGFPRRRGGLSASRLLGSGLVELGTYVIRLALVFLWNRMIPTETRLNHLAGLVIAYTAGFVFGYLTRYRLVFKVEEEEER